MGAYNSMYSTALRQREKDFGTIAIVAKFMFKLRQFKLRQYSYSYRLPKSMTAKVFRHLNFSIHTLAAEL